LAFVILYLNACIYLVLVETWHFKDNGGTTFIFEVTWRHRSHDNSTCGGWLFMGGLLWPYVYL